MKIATIKCDLNSLKIGMKDMSKDKINNKKIDILLLIMEDIVNKLEKKQEGES